MPRKERNGHRVLEPAGPNDILIGIAEALGRLEGQVDQGLTDLKERISLHAAHHGERIEDLSLRVGSLESHRHGASPASASPPARWRDMLPIKELLAWATVLGLIGTIELARLLLPPEALGLILKLAPAAANAI